MLVELPVKLSAPRLFSVQSFFFPGGSDGKKKKICLQCERPRFNSSVRKIPWKRAWQPTSVFLPGEPHGQRSLVSYGPWDHKELDMTEMT